ncbi:phosphotransferase enzyme family protein [Alicyclobacillus fodiniaquatilis]|uniref:Phosphotransferase enzyme family protein n=1 Tax=Alicyclobacillus fodiniaquatilis TaxID=1661150 RepID=A0ABW4JSB6_9BACL
MSFNDEILPFVRMGLSRYRLDLHSLGIENHVKSYNWHGDIHLKIRIGQSAFSARFIGTKRYQQEGNDEFVALTDGVLADQMEYCDFLVRHSIPFMCLQRTSDGSPFARFDWCGDIYRCVLFHWISGEHITHTTPNAAYRLGEMARKIHDLSHTYPHRLSFPTLAHTKGYRKRVLVIERVLQSNQVPQTGRKQLEQYLTNAQQHILNANIPFRNDCIVITSDLNSLNVLWDETENISGIVDFEHIAYGERVETLAWLIKWYSRTSGIESHDMSPLLAREVLRGYHADALLNKSDYTRLRSLLWLSGCMNWNFVDKTLKILESNAPEQLETHLERYQRRGQALVSLLDDF